MTPTQVVELCRLWMDEPDTTFITDAQLEVLLDQSYLEYRGLTLNTDATPYQLSTTITVNGSAFNLATTATGAGILLGASAVATKLSRILDIVELQSGSVVRRFTPVTTIEFLQTQPDSFAWMDTSIVFNQTLAGTFTMYYVGVPNITWTGGSPSAFIDDTDEMHEMIAILAYQRYAVRDGAGNVQLDKLLARRWDQFQMWLKNRVRDKSNFVQRSLTLRYS